MQPWPRNLGIEGAQHWSSAPQTGEVATAGGLHARVPAGQALVYITCTGVGVVQKDLLRTSERSWRTS